MIEFLKILFKKFNFKHKDENLNTYNKIIFSIIIITAILFIILIMYFIIKIFPDFMDSLQTNWNESKSQINYLKLK